MPTEIFWEIHPRGNDWFDWSEGTNQAVRFRRPQLIKVEDIVSAFREFLNYWNNPHERGVEMISAVLRKDEKEIYRGIEEGSIEPVMITDDHFSCLVHMEMPWQGWPRSIIIDEERVFKEKEKEPAPIFRGEDDKVLSFRNTYCFPLKIVPTDLDIRDSSFCISHNIPLEERLVMGSCTWFNFSQPSTTIELRIDNDWWAFWWWCHKKRERQESQTIRQIAGNLYWFFQRWINSGELVNQLTKKGYDLRPQFNPSWTSCVMEDQCQECGEIHASLPYKLSEVRVGEISKNYCYCRWKRDYRYPGGIKRTFKVIGAYPISPIEADCASCEGALQFDSAD
jgi:hypothetical protein